MTALGNNLYLQKLVLSLGKHSEIYLDLKTPTSSSGVDLMPLTTKRVNPI